MKRNYFRFTTAAASFYASGSVAMLALGVVLLPSSSEWNWSAVIESVSSLFSSKGMGVLGLAVAALMSADRLKNKWPILAQHIAYIGFLIMLFPGTLLLSGMPEDLGWISALLVFGLIMLLGSGGAYAAARFFPVKTSELNGS